MKTPEELNASLDRKNNLNPRSALSRDSQNGQFGSAPQFIVELADVQTPTAKPTSPATSDEPSPDRASPSTEDEDGLNNNNATASQPEDDDKDEDEDESANNNNTTASQPKINDKGKEELKDRSTNSSQEEAANHDEAKPVASQSLQDFCLFSTAALDLNNLTAVKIMRLKNALTSNTRAPIIQTVRVPGNVLLQLRGFSRPESHTRMRDAMNKQYLEAIKHLIIRTNKGDKKAEAVLSELKLIFQNIQNEQLTAAASFSSKDLLDFDIEKLWQEAKILKTTNKANKFCKLQESIECNEIFLRKKLLIIIDGLKNLAENGDNEAATKLSQFMATFRANEVSRLKTLETNKLKPSENLYSIPKMCEKLVKKLSYEDTLLQQAIYAYIQDADQCRLSPFLRQCFALTMIYTYAHKNVAREAKFGPLITGEPLVVTNLKSKFAAAAKIDFNEHTVWEFMHSIKKDLKVALSTYIGYRKSHTVKTYSQHTAVNEQLIKDIEMMIAWVTSTDVRFDAEIDSDDNDMLILSPQSASAPKTKKSPEAPMTPVSPWMDFGGHEEETTTPMTPISPWMDFATSTEKVTPKMIPVPPSPPAMQPVYESDSNSSSIDDEDEAQNNDDAEDYSDDLSRSM